MRRGEEIALSHMESGVPGQMADCGILSASDLVAFVCLDQEGQTIMDDISSDVAVLHTQILFCGGDVPGRGTGGLRLHSDCGWEGASE